MTTPRNFIHTRILCTHAISTFSFLHTAICQPTEVIIIGSFLIFRYFLSQCLRMYEYSPLESECHYLHSSRSSDQATLPGRGGGCHDPLIFTHLRASSGWSLVTWKVLMWSPLSWMFRTSEQWAFLSTRFFWWVTLFVLNLNYISLEVPTFFQLFLWPPPDEPWNFRIFYFILNTALIPPFFGCNPFVLHSHLLGDRKFPSLGWGLERGEGTKGDTYFFTFLLILPILACHPNAPATAAGHRSFWRRRFRPEQGRTPGGRGQMSSFKGLGLGECVCVHAEFSTSQT